MAPGGQALESRRDRFLRVLLASPYDPWDPSAKGQAFFPSRPQVSENVTNANPSVIFKGVENKQFPRKKTNQAPNVSAVLVQVLCVAACPGPSVPVSPAAC